MKQNEEQFDVANYVMSNPRSYPEVFESIILSVNGLNWPFVARCRQVSSQWSNAIDELLRRNPRSLRDKIDEGWESRPLNLTKCNHSGSSSRDVRCFIGDKANHVFGLYSGAIEVVFNMRQGRLTLRKATMDRSSAWP